MATLLAHIRVRPESGPAFEAILRDLFAASHATEPALLRYEYWRGEQPGFYYCLQSFYDYAGFIAHEVSPHHEVAGPLLMDIIEDFRLEWVDPVDGAAPLAETDREPPTQSWTERENFYASMFPWTIASWWPGASTATAQGEAA